MRGPLSRDRLGTSGLSCLRVARAGTSPRGESNFTGESATARGEIVLSPRGEIMLSLRYRVGTSGAARRAMRSHIGHIGSVMCGSQYGLAERRLPLRDCVVRNLTSAPGAIAAALLGPRAARPARSEPYGEAFVPAAHRTCRQGRDARGWRGGPNLVAACAGGPPGVRLRDRNRCRCAAATGKESDVGQFMIVLSARVENNR